MAHPKMFDEDDPILARVRELARSFPDSDENQALRDDPRFYVPAYPGPSGWLGFDLDDLDDDGWSEAAELMDASYRLTAPPRCVALLDRGAHDDG